jgi:hypothetical protein
MDAGSERRTTKKKEEGKEKKSMKRYTIATLLTVGALLSACSKPTEPQPQAVPVLDIFVAAEPTGKPTPIPEARNQFGPGDTVLLKGLVMGTKFPFVDGRAVFILGDEGTLTHCAAMHGDGCPTPWDTCCEPPDVRKAGTATIQVIGPDGRVLTTGLKGMNGLKELSQVTVAGTVAQGASADAFIVNATAIYITTM